MVKSCCIKNCLSNGKKRSKKVSLHLFPANNPKLFKKWIEFAGYGDDWRPAKYAALCSLHFTPLDFRVNTNICCLKPDAFPTVKSNIASIERYAAQNAINGANVDSVAEVKNTCRLCGNEYNTAIKRIFGEDDSYALLIRDHLRLNITREDSLPLSVCVICETKLDKFVEFFNDVHEVQKIFEQKCDKTEVNEQLYDVKFVNEFETKRDTDEKDRVETNGKIISNSPFNENYKLLNFEISPDSGELNNNEANVSMIPQSEEIDDVNNLAVICVDADGRIYNNGQPNTNNEHTFEENKKIEFICIGNNNEENNQINIDVNPTFKDSFKMNDSEETYPNKGYNSNEININENSVISTIPIEGYSSNNNMSEIQFLFSNSDVKTVPKFTDHYNYNQNIVSHGNVANIIIPIKKEMETPNNDFYPETSAVKTNHQNLGKKIEILQDIKIDPNKMDFKTFRILQDDTLNNLNKISYTIKHEKPVTQPKKRKKKTVKCSNVMYENICKQCGSRFINKYSLNNHIKYICEKQPNFTPKKVTCNICINRVLPNSKPNIKKCLCSKKSFSKNVSVCKKRIKTEQTL